MTHYVVNDYFQRPWPQETHGSFKQHRRKYDDKTAKAALAHTQAFLLQTYRRDMGGGKFSLMKDASAPITIAGRRWGGLRVCYRA